MGFAYTGVSTVNVLSSQITLYAPLIRRLNLQTSAANFSLGSITIPADLKGTIQAIYVDLGVASIFNGTASVNDILDNTNVEAADHSIGTYQVALTLPSQVYEAAASSRNGGFFFSGGTNNLLTTIPSLTQGSQIDIRAYQLKSRTGNMELQFVQPGVRVVLRW